MGVTDLIDAWYRRPVGVPPVSSPIALRPGSLGGNRSDLSPLCVGYKSGKAGVAAGPTTHYLLVSVRRSQ